MENGGDYEDAEDNNNEVEVLSDDDDDDVKTVVGIKRTFKEELEEESIEVVEVVTAPVQYNNSKYFKKRKVCQRTEIIGEFSQQQKTDLTFCFFATELNNKHRVISENALASQNFRFL